MCRLRPLTFLPPSWPRVARPTVSAPLTDCASTIAAEAIGSRPSASQLVAQRVVHPVQAAVRAPPLEVPEHRLPRRELPRQQPPGAAGAHHVQNRIDDLAARVLLPATGGGRRRQQGFNQPPLLVRQVGVVPARRRGGRRHIPQGPSDCSSSRGGAPRRSQTRSYGSGGRAPGGRSRRGDRGGAGWFVADGPPQRPRARGERGRGRRPLRLVGSAGPAVRRAGRGHRATCPPVTPCPSADPHLTSVTRAAGGRRGPVVSATRRGCPNSRDRRVGAGDRDSGWWPLRSRAFGDAPWVPEFPGPRRGGGGPGQRLVAAPVPWFRRRAVGARISGTAARKRRPQRRHQGQLPREVSASPNNFAAITRDRTAMIVGFSRTIQSRNPISKPLPRSCISTWMARGIPGPTVPSATNTATADACAAAPAPTCATATPAPIESSRFFGLTTLNSTARPAAFAAVTSSSLRIQPGASVSALPLLRRHCRTAKSTSSRPRTIFTALTHEAGVASAPSASSSASVDTNARESTQPPANAHARGTPSAATSITTAATIASGLSATPTPKARTSPIA